eukprot:5761730-Amphidinium_carterae.1
MFFTHYVHCLGQKWGGTKGRDDEEVGGEERVGRPEFNVNGHSHSAHFTPNNEHNVTAVLNDF